MKRYDYLKQQHRCVRCGERDERTVAGKTLCDKCSEQSKYYANKHKKRYGEIKRKYSKERYYRLVSLGLCVCCGKESVKNNNRRCPACSLKYSEINKKYYLKKKERERTYESEKETA